MGDTAQESEEIIDQAPYGPSEEVLQFLVVMTHEWKTAWTDLYNKEECAVSFSCVTNSPQHAVPSLDHQSSSSTIVENNENLLDLELERDDSRIYKEDAWRDSSEKHIFDQGNAMMETPWD